jgi:hypothetical protein
VIVHPESMPEAAALWEARARYAPGARFWLYGPESAPQLRAVVEADVATWGAKPEVVVKPYPPRTEPEARGEARPRGGQPRLKLAGDGGAQPPPEGEEERGNLLTPEELQMLLGEDEPGTGEQR